MTTVEIRITSEDPNFSAVLAALAGNPAPAAPKSEPVADAPAAAPKATRTRASAKPASEGSADTTEKTNADATSTASSAPSAGDEAANKAAYEEVKKRIMAGSEKDREKTASILRTFGVARGSELTPDQYPAAMEALDELLEDEPEDLS